MSEQSFQIFVVEDDDWYRKLLVHTLSLNPDHSVKAFADGESMLKELKNKPQLVTLDFRLPDYSGSELFDKIKSVDPEIEVIIISEQQDIETAINLLKKGAYDYLTKTDDIRDRLIHVLNKLGKNKKLEAKVESLQQEVEKKYEFQSNIIGQSAGIKKVFRLIEKAITTNITVMITGETGTGKEVVAKSIHYNGKQKSKPFVPVNMSAIPKDLVESELFGHEKGSFTGATGKHIGKFEQAQGGTLFLDEIGEMDISLQAKLLRALQEKEITRVGGSSPIKVDCRVIVATHRNLQKEVKEGNFREDLYYRLFGLPIELPPLRERDKDVIILAKHFAEAFAKENDQEIKSFTKDTLQKLMNYSFPGNIRELKSIVELAMVMADGNEISPDDITFAQKDVLADVLTEEMSMKEYQMRIIHLYLKKYSEDIKMVADKLDIGQSTIYRLLKEEKESSQ
ncbi:DNA-binding transcriptional response regulator, NtrC family, contains REC, AAA-type ATPase, and a Fis-type DNA-binding domains [Ekhidna lutea]|uniref:DNA-binding transcriptional response regulator, NtrC family, contains REC, AAA-type ATPase, and a Fis-type DNA-binding domains n=1 Tax=Ekhidna lutea TaxID=447679 RepID=A0A239KG19_EKHLU|nr:sigma-54 dependent transcriptional regulator [Ekhidna lutea]SNT17015.1 DNA-binding transcriptional response regulator, NtrC family, contains REC, AAA-type ATPase, and a Fis-type DNA-binding domains [Ekhidna lutea]